MAKMLSHGIRLGGLLCLGALLWMPGCGDTIDNALEINGVRSQNMIMSVEGNWKGYFAPDQNWRPKTHVYPEPLKKPCITNGADVRIEAHGEVVTGKAVTREGQTFELRGFAWAGTSYSGLNSINARLSWKGREIGHLWLVPGTDRNQLTGRYYFRISPDHYICSNEASLQRMPN